MPTNRKAPVLLLSTHAGEAIFTTASHPCRSSAERLNTTEEIYTGSQRGGRQEETSNRRLSQRLCGSQITDKGSGIVQWAVRGSDADQMQKVGIYWCWWQKHFGRFFSGSLHMNRGSVPTMASSITITGQTNSFFSFFSVSGPVPSLSVIALIEMLWILEQGFRTHAR